MFVLLETKIHFHGLKAALLAISFCHRAKGVAVLEVLHLAIVALYWK